MIDQESEKALCIWRATGFSSCSISAADWEGCEDPPNEGGAAGFRFNLMFGDRLQALERRAMQHQYQLACLSTLGGAYHLCRRPQQAYVLAVRQEAVGRSLGSSVVVLRARVFQAVNHYALGRREQGRACMAWCRQLVQAMRRSSHPAAADMAHFLCTYQGVLRRDYHTDSSSSGSSSGGLHGQRQGHEEDHMEEQVQVQESSCSG